MCRKKAKIRQLPIWNVYMNSKQERMQYYCILLCTSPARSSTEIKYLSDTARSYIFTVLYKLNIKKIYSLNIAIKSNGMVEPPSSRNLRF